MFFRGISTLPRSSWEILPGQLSSQIRSKKCKYLRKNITLTWINHDVVYFTSSCMQGLFYELPQTSSIFDLVKDGNSLKKNSIMVKVSGDPPDLFSQTCHSLTPHRWNPIHPLWGCPSNKQFWKITQIFFFYREEHKIRWYYIKSHFCQFFELVLPARHCWHPGRNPRSMLGSASLACSWCCTWSRWFVMLKRKEKNIETRTT